jgi:hypothetical protein
MGAAVLDDICVLADEEVVLASKDVWSGNKALEENNAILDGELRRQRWEEMTYLLLDEGAVLVTETVNGDEIEVKLDYDKIAERLKK